MSIITISREVGSQGDEIARAVAQRLNHELVGQVEVHNMAEQCDAKFKDACALYEREAYHGFMERFFSNHDAHKSLFESMHLELAAKGNVVILGRGAHLALKGSPGVFHVRLVAPKAFRVARVMEATGMEEYEAVDYVERHDHERRVLIQSLFHEELDDLSLYDLVLNTAGYSVEDAAGVIVLAEEARLKLEITPAGLSEEFSRRALAKKIEAAIRKEVTASTLRNIEVKVEPGGKAVIEGIIHSEQSKDTATEIAASFEGITTVENNLVSIQYGV